MKNTFFNKIKRFLGLHKESIIFRVEEGNGKFYLYVKHTTFSLEKYLGYSANLNKAVNYARIYSQDHIGRKTIKFYRDYDYSRNNIYLTIRN